MLMLAAPVATPLAMPGLGAMGSPSALSQPMQIIVLLTLLTLLPAIVMSITPFLRITIVLHFLRQALGTQNTPSNQVLVGLSMFLTLLIIQPLAGEIYDKAWVPMEKGQMTLEQGITEGSRPLRSFLIKFVREKDVQLFLDISHTAAPRTPADLDMKIVIPAYILSELKASFQIGAVLYLPFLIIDVIVASVTLSIGMVQLPPAMVSAPFKILLFVLIDGWNLVVGSLMKSLVSP
jgi:flagellar biosynthetic protein FliP